jgi:hypothetical protein
MDRRSDGVERDGIAPDMGRVQPRMKGRTLPVPPLIPSIAAIGLLFGLVVGFGMGSTVQRLTAWPTDGPVVTEAPTPTPSPTLEPSPPTGGASIEKMLASLKGAGYDPLPGAVSARIVPGADVQTGQGPTLPEWVWVVTWPSSCIPVGGPGAAESASPAPVLTPWPCLEAAVFDYQSGLFLFTTVPVSGW